LVRQSAQMKEGWTSLKFLTWRIFSSSSQVMKVWQSNFTWKKLEAKYFSKKFCICCIYKLTYVPKSIYYYEISDYKNWISSQWCTHSISNGSGGFQFKSRTITHVGRLIKKIHMDSTSSWTYLKPTKNLRTITIMMMANKR